MSKTIFNLKGLIAISLIPFMFSCAKSKDDSKILIDTESIRTMAEDPTMKLAHVVLNVRGPNMNLINIVWDGKKDDGNTFESPPEYFEITVPSGPDRLIQYLGVYENADEQMQFYYADSQMSFGPGDVAVELIASPFGVPTKETSLKGRYLRADGTSPTGRVEWLVVPPGGKPLMYVDDEFIYSGWFKFMAFDGVPITYRMKATGEVLFDGLLGGPATGQHLMKLTFSDFYHGYTHEGVLNCSLSGSSSSTLYWGYYGPGSAGKTVSYDDYMGAGPLFADTTNGYGLYKSCSPPSPVALGWSDVAPAGGAQVVSCSGEGICLSGADFRSGVERSYSHGPFRAYNETGDSQTRFDGAIKITLQATPPHNISKIEWQLLPGVAAVLKDIEIYTRPSLGNFNGDWYDDELHRLGCSAYLVQEGFNLARTVGAATTSITSNMDQFIGKDIALCPRFNVAGMVVSGIDAPQFHSEAEAQVTGIPGNLFDGVYYTNQPIATLTVAGVTEFKYQLAFGYTSCDTINYDPLVPKTGGTSISVDYTGQLGSVYLCVTARNEGGEWSYPKPVAEWKYDTDPPASPYVSCTGDVNGFTVQVDYSEGISNLADLTSTVEVRYQGGVDPLTATERTHSLPYSMSFTFTDSADWIKVGIGNAVDLAGNQRALENIENIECTAP